MNLVAILGVGMTAGVLSGLVGVGGGVILVPAMVVLTGMPIHKAVGVSLAVIVPTALAGAVKHSMAGNMDLRVALALASTAVIGSVLGATLANQLPALVLRRVFGVFLVLVGLNLLFGWTDLVQRRALERPLSGQGEGRS